MGTNMLSVKKVKLHGMQSTRWGTQDKIAQYKHLISLYERDKKILETDTLAARRKLKKEIKNLRVDIDDRRKDLDNVIQGDRQRLRNTLAEHRSLQLAYQHYNPTKVVEVLYQQNFIKRKQLDLLKYKMKQKTEKLTNLKLTYADLEDRIKYEAKEKIPEEEVAQIITAKVQDAELKHETALEVQRTYKKIRNVLKKDAVYYDAVLSTLYLDGYNQGNCILKVTEMGQIATEYLDDRKDEYFDLEKALINALKEREKSVNDMQDKIDELNNCVKFLIRRDSVMEIDDDKKVVESHAEVQLQNDIENIKLTLNRIRDLAAVTYIEDICPKAGDQYKQKTRLENMIKKTMQDREVLFKKVKHTEEIFNDLCHNMVETTMWYKDEKARLNEEIQNVIEDDKKVVDLIKKRGETCVKVRTSLQHIAEILRNIAVPGGTRGSSVKRKTEEKEEDRQKLEKLEKGAEGDATDEDKNKDKKDDKSSKVKIRERTKSRDKDREPQKRRTTYGEVNPPIKPEATEIDLKVLIADITRRLQVLVAASGEQPEQEITEECVQTFETFITNMTISTLIKDTEDRQEPLIEEVQFDDGNVPTRFDIKKMSKEICDKNAKQEWEV